MEFKLFKTLFILVLVACLAGFATDIYAPSFLTLTKDFSTSLPDVQRSMSIFMLFLSLTQLIYGPLSEVVGRRIPLLIGLFLMAVGSCVCIYATNMDQFMIGRVVQGIGAGAGACLWRSIFRDLFNSEQIAKYVGYVGIATVYIVAASPFLGGYLETHPGWRASFVTIMGYALSAFLLVYFMLPETNIHHTKDRLNIKFFFNAFKQLLTSRVFMGYAFCVFFTYGAFFSWFVVGPVLLVSHINVSPETFGLINLCLGGTAMALGGIFNGKVVRHLGQNTMLRIGWGLIISAGVMLFVLNLLYGAMLAPTLICVFIFLFGATLVWPNAFAGAFAPFGSIAGYASALYSTIQFGGGAIIGWVSSSLPSHKPYTLPFIFILTALCAWLLFEYVVRKSMQKSC